MARLTIKGLEEFSMTLERLGNDAEGVMKAAVYAGADKADQIVQKVAGSELRSPLPRTRVYAD